MLLCIICSQGLVTREKTHQVINNTLKSSLSISSFLSWQLTSICRWLYLNRLMTKPTKWLCAQRRLKTNLGNRPVWSESLLCAQWVAEDPSFLHVGSEDSDQTGWTPRLIWDFAGQTGHFVGFVMRWQSLFDIWYHCHTGTSIVSKVSYL